MIITTILHIWRYYSINDDLDRAFTPIYLLKRRFCGIYAMLPLLNDQGELHDG